VRQSFALKRYFWIGNGKVVIDEFCPALDSRLVIFIVTHSSPLAQKFFDERLRL